MDTNEYLNKSFSVGCIETVKRYAKKLGFDTIFNRYKTKGDKLSNLVSGLVTHKLHFSKSINHASCWLNLSHIRNEFYLSENVPKTYYRVLETLGMHERNILTSVQNRLHELYHFKSTDLNMDWSSLVLYGTKALLGGYGYSRAHRPDKKQITFGVSQLREPFNIPFSLSTSKGNTVDKIHFKKTFSRTIKALLPNSLIIVDKGANTKDIKELIVSKEQHYLCAASLSSKHNALIKKFDRNKCVLVEKKDDYKTYCFKYTESKEIQYLFFSEKLYADTIARKRGIAERRGEEGRLLEKKVSKGKKQKPKKMNLLAYIAETKINLQQRLKPLKKKELTQMIFDESLSGREGFFLLKSSKNLTEKDALCFYRGRDTVEKLIDSLKNTIGIKPVRVWTDNEIEGALLVSFFAQLILSMMQFEHSQLHKLRPNTLLSSLRNLTLTIIYRSDFTHERIISNYDEINPLVFGIKTRIT